MRTWITVFTSVLVLMVGTTVYSQETLSERASRASQLLAQQAEEFRKEVIRITDGVHMAVGFDGSNCAMIEGTDGVVIVDTLRATESAEAVMAEFRKITTKPVKAIIYTHSHEDHIGGASVFAGKDNPEIYSRSNFSPDTDAKLPVAPIIARRGVRMFGRDLPDKDITIRGIAPGKTPTGGVGKGRLPATRTFSEPRLKITVGGVVLELVAAPGETDDQLYVWAPEKKVLFCGDNFYKAFPNLYTIRGTSYRDVRDWAESLDRMSLEGAEYLVTGHTRPVLGKVLVKESLENYRDAIRSVFKQTIDGINRGLTPDELVEVVKLPPEFAEKPYLKEFYGNVPFTVRSIFNGYLGWFDGNASTLLPLSQKEEAKQIARLAGGEENLMAELRKTIERKEWQWACQLADRIIVLGGVNASEAKKIKSKALRELGEEQHNAPARNYYLSSALELERQPSK